MPAVSADPRKVRFPPGIPLVALVASWLLGRAWPIGVAWPAWTRMVGWIVFLAPWLFAMWAIRTFRRHGTAVKPRGTVTTIVTTGPFQLSRNPMYVTLMTSYVGATLAFHLAWGVVFLVPVFLALHFGVILREERHLEDQFGGQYRKYRRRVRRWL